jgi:hypothetical protein
MKKYEFNNQSISITIKNKGISSMSSPISGPLPAIGAPHYVAGRPSTGSDFNQTLLTVFMQISARRIEEDRNDTIITAVKTICITAFGCVLAWKFAHRIHVN